MPSRHLLVPALLAAGVIAGCGSSNNSDTAHIQAPPSASQTLTYSATATSSSTATTPAVATPTIVTPKSGPLSKEPTIKVPKGAAPKTLVKLDLITGTGAAAAAGDTITVNYKGALYSNGKVFDASWLRKQTFSTPLGVGSVIAGWDQGLVGMRVGGRRELIIPPPLAYKAAGSPPTIPPNATLIFIIDLLAVTPPNGATARTGATVAAGATAATGATGATG
jgi:FKBP-type peptidyl-prolyl cis-trans isomerase